MASTAHQELSVSCPPLTEASPRSWENLSLGLILLLASFLRCWELELKPTHFDEGINGNFVSQMWMDGFYKYDPSNFHGPLYFYILQLTELLFGWGIKYYRLVNVLLSVCSVALVAAHKRFLGPKALWAALLLAISPAFVFYSRYAIHETLFILAQLLFSYGYFSWKSAPSKKALLMMSAGGVGLMTTKETFVFFFITWAIAAMFVDLLERWHPLTVPHSTAPPSASHVSLRSVVAALACVTLATLFIFTGSFQNLRGGADFFTAFTHWTKTASSQSGHEKPFLYFLALMHSCEWPFFMALFAGPLLLLECNKPSKHLFIFGTGAFLSYSLIPYKTPWLILNILWPFSFSFGDIAQGNLTLSASKRFINAFARFLAFALLAFCFLRMWNLNFRDFASDAEPYVYVQSTKDFKKVIDLLSTAVRDRPEYKNLRIAVLHQDSWPLPYVLSPYPNHYYATAGACDLRAVDIVFADAGDRETVVKKLSGEFYVLPFRIRNAHPDGLAFLSTSTFRQYLPVDTAWISGGTR
jgi:uncharacterized protein (TIGR03663 family)